MALPNAEAIRTLEIAPSVSVKQKTELKATVMAYQKLGFTLRPVCSFNRNFSSARKSFPVKGPECGETHQVPVNFSAKVSALVAELSLQRLVGRRERKRMEEKRTRERETERLGK
ncbi:hypothetical protein AMTR_s00007p00268010 [Amborella trichopoda]|uniref:Uncharacterized protein n=1 Tax=Amborella trichopoda TaxID=13333 RepID=W1PES8_AMBTC|nr:hypothetical protein AMTR_s00007p00268010 [Amborella trichopoda]